MYIIGLSHKFSFMMTYQQSHKAFAAINPMKYTSPNENFEFSHPNSNALLHLLSKKNLCFVSNQSVASCHATKFYYNSIE